MRPARADRGARGILADLWEFEEKPAGLREAGARVLPWAFGEGSGAFLYWLARPGQHPAEWTALYNEGRGPLWERHDMGCLAFLSAVLDGTAETEYFGSLRETTKPGVRRLATAGAILGTAGR